MKNGWTHCLWHCRSSMETGLPDALDFSVKAKMVLVKMCKHGDTCSLGGVHGFSAYQENFPKVKNPWKLLEQKWLSVLVHEETQQTLFWEEDSRKVTQQQQQHGINLPPSCIPGWKRPHFTQICLWQTTPPSIQWVWWTWHWDLDFPAVSRFQRWTQCIHLQDQSAKDCRWYFLICWAFSPHVSPTDTSWKPQGHNKWELEPPTKKYRVSEKICKLLKWSYRPNINLGASSFSFHLVWKSYSLKTICRLIFIFF